MPDITLSPTPLNRGPFAAVYRGWDRFHRCDVIVKVQRETDDPVAMDRFRREAAVMRRLRHPNIVALYRFYDGDPAALVMEYVPGRTLEKLVGADGWLPAPRVAAIMEEVAAALDCAHALGIVHRDVKPSNILLPRRGAARLSDFGVAHIGGPQNEGDNAPLTVMGDILGTIEYASPEQVHGNERPDARSDVYSLAAVAYFALVATPPFRAADNSTQAQLSVMHRQVFADPPPLRFHREDLAPEIENVVLRGLAKAPDARYQSAGQFAAALRGAVEAGSGTPEGLAMAASSRHTGALTGALAGVALLLIAAVGLWKVNHAAPPAPVPSPEAWHFPTHPVYAPIVPSVHVALPASLPVKPPPPAPPKPPVMAVLPPTVPQPPRPPLTPMPPPVPKPMATVKPPARPVKIAVRPVVTPKPHKIMPVVRMPAPPKKTVVARHPLIVPPPILVSHLTPSEPAKVISPPKPLRLVVPPPKPTTPKPAAAPAQAWLYVYANQNIAPLGRTPRMASIHAEAVYVDGKPVPALTAGQWAALPAGTHVLSFFPEPRSGFSPHTGVTVTLSPQAHVYRQILLPVQTRAVTHVIAVPPAPPHPAPRRVILPQPPPRPQAKVPAAAPAVGWVYVSGVRFVNAAGQPREIVRIPAQSVTVDGKPVPELASGHWAQLPAGPHVLTFVPVSGLEAGAASQSFSLSSKSHLQQQISLPSVPPTHLRNP